MIQCKCINKDCSKTFLLFSSIALHLFLVWLLSYTRLDNVTKAIVVLNSTKLRRGHAVTSMHLDITICMYTHFQSLIPLYYLCLATLDWIPQPCLCLATLRKF